MFKTIVAAALGCFLFASAAHAAVVVDQVNMPDPNVQLGGIQGTALSGQGSVAGQRFTVGKTGQMTQIDLWIRGPTNATGGFTFNLEDLSGAQVFSSHVDYSALPTTGSWFGEALQVDLSAANLLVDPGDGYKIVLEVDAGSSAVGWYYMFNETLLSYAGGEGFIRQSSGDILLTNLDYGFRTYVTSAVPEPGAWALMILGFGGVGAALRRRRGGAAGRVLAVAA